jgi:hypothetical protein
MERKITRGRKGSILKWPFSAETAFHSTWRPTGPTFESFLTVDVHSSKMYSQIAASIKKPRVDAAT